MSENFEALVERAARQVLADERMLRALVDARRAAGLTQRQVADILGIKQSSIAAFERHDNDPKLSTIQRYALAVGAEIEHRVSCDAWGGEWLAFRHASAFFSTPAPAVGQVAVNAPANSKSTDFAVAA